MHYIIDTVLIMAYAVLHEAETIPALMEFNSLIKLDILSAN